MLLETIVICLIARRKGYHIRDFLKSFPVILVLIVQVIAIIAEFSLFFNVRTFLPLARYLESATIISYLPAILIYKLYSPAIVGSAGVLIGTCLNKVVIIQNGGKMPVFPTLSYITGFVTPEFIETVDTLHVLGDSQTKLKCLTDCIDFGYCILSVGDVFIHFFYCLMLYQMIKAVCSRKPAEKL